MEEKVYSVGALTRSIRNNLLENNPKIASVWIEGEISGCKIYSSGHRYFGLKDKDALINCVLFSFRLPHCDEAFRQSLARGEENVNGMKVQVQGELDLNMGRGQYSFKVVKLRVSGLGDRMRQYQERKAEIEAKGRNKLDHPELRRALPFLPHRVGVVTSAAGAVIHDICEVLLRRFPNVEVRLYPVKVQGEGAAESIEAGVRFFNGELVNSDPSWKADVIIVGRGGGSVDDLWCFNEPPVIRAVAASKIPIVSAVGHESDVTLCDYVADLRAGTPSIAAEKVVPVKRELEAKVEQLAERLAHAPMGACESAMQQLDYLTHRLGVAPQGVLTRLERRLVDLRHRLGVAPQGRLTGMERRLVDLRHRLEQIPLGVLAQVDRRLQGASLRLKPPMRMAIQRAEARVAAAGTKLALLNPFEVLSRGYSITLDAKGRAVRSAGEVKRGDRLSTRFGDGVVTVEAVGDGEVVNA